MEPIRTVVVLDAADLHAESAFWAGMLDGHVFDDERFHSVIDAAGEWRIGVQLAPTHVPPDWPDGAPQQVHIDLHVEDPKQAHEQAMRLGARLLRADDLESDEGHQVYADPAGHPFCIGWGHPSREALAAFVRERLAQTSGRPASASRTDDPCRWARSRVTLHTASCREEEPDSALTNDAGGEPEEKLSVFVLKPPPRRSAPRLLSRRSTHDRLGRQGKQDDEHSSGLV